jgi:hypothetical protein
MRLVLSLRSNSVSPHVSWHVDGVASHCQCKCVSEFRALAARYLSSLVVEPLVGGVLAFGSTHDVP